MAYKGCILRTDEAKGDLSNDPPGGKISRFENRKNRPLGFTPRTPRGNMNHPKEGTYGPSWNLLRLAVKLIEEQMKVIKNQERLIRYYKKEIKKNEKN